MSETLEHEERTVVRSLYEKQQRAVMEPEAREKLQRYRDTHPCPICGYLHSCDCTVTEVRRAYEKLAIDAALSPNKETDR